MASLTRVVIELESSEDETVDAGPSRTSAPLRARGRNAWAPKSETVDLTDEAAAVPKSSRKERKLRVGDQPSASSGASQPSKLVIDLCDDDGLLATDDDGADFARQFQQSFDEVEIVGERWATAPPPVSRANTSSGSSAATTSCAASSSTHGGVIDVENEDGDAPNTEGDEDFAARLQAEVDEEIRRDGEHRQRLAGQDEEFARTLQMRLDRELAESDRAAAGDILREQRNRIREWLRTQASTLKVQDVVQNPAALPNGHLYLKFKAAFDAAKDKSVRLVFHGTSEANIDSILRDGLNPQRRGQHGQAHGAGEYFAERPDISVPYCAGGKKMIVFAVLMDTSGLTKRAGGIVVVNKTEHQLPMFVISFEPTQAQALYGGVYANPAAAAAALAAAGYAQGAAASAAARLQALLQQRAMAYAAPRAPAYKPPAARRARASGARKRRR